MMPKNTRTCMHGEILPIFFKQLCIHSIYYIIIYCVIIRYICSHFKCIIFDAWEYIVAKRIADVLPAQPHNGKSPEQKGSSKNGRRKKQKIAKSSKNEENLNVLK